MIKLPGSLRIAVVFAAVLVLEFGAANNAVAADDVIEFGKETLKFNLGYYQPTFRSRVAVGLPESAPPSISGEEDLGLNNNLGGYRLDGYWRFADRHRLYFGYYQLDRSSTKVLDKNIGPIEIPQLGVSDTILAGSNISAEAKWQVYILGYGYSFYKSETLEFAGKFGLNVVQMGTQLSGTLITQNHGTQTAATAGSVLTVPMPAFGFTGDWAPAERWRVRGSAGAFQIQFANVHADVVDAGLAGEFRLYRNIWLGTGYSTLNATVSSNSSNSTAYLDWRTGGWQLYGSMLF